MTQDEFNKFVYQAKQPKEPDPMPIIGGLILAKYLKLYAWTAIDACLLVTGIDPDSGVQAGWDFIDMRTQFINTRTFANNDLFYYADKVFLQWSSQIEPPQKITPIDFVSWCDTNKFNTDGITKTDEWADYLMSQAEPVPDADAGSCATKPREGGYKERDEFAIKLVNDRPELLVMRPGEIKTKLQAASKLFISGYDGWWRKNPVFDKGMPGRNPK